MGFEPTEWYLGKVLPYHLATPAMFRKYFIDIEVICQSCGFYSCNERVQESNLNSKKH